MRKLVTGLLGLILIIAPGLGAADEIDTAIPDTLRIEKVQVTKTGPIAVRVSIFNDEEIAGLTIPLAVIGKGLLIDSVSFVGSRVEYIKTRPVTISEDRKKVVFGAITMMEEYLQAGNGLMATLYLSLTDSSVNGKFMVDTTTIGPASVLYSKKDSYSFIPQFVPGQVTIGKESKDSPKKTK